jgi:hypothetical protein
LISNIGYGINATHTTKISIEANLNTYNIGILTHPTFICPDIEADLYTYQKLHYINLVDRIINSIKYRLNKFIKSFL